MQGSQMAMTWASIDALMGRLYGDDKDQTGKTVMTNWFFVNDIPVYEQQGTAKSLSVFGGVC